MKRIYSKIPVQSVLYVMSGNQEIKVFDYDNEYDLIYDKDFTRGRCVLEGKAKDIIGYRYARITSSAIHGIDIKDNAVYIRIWTKNDEY